MTVDVTDLTTTAQEQFFSTLESIQGVVLESVKLWSGAVKSVTPEELTKSVPAAATEWIPAPATYVALPFEFAEKLLAHQREFLTQVLAETAAAPDPAPASASALPVTAPVPPKPAQAPPPQKKATAAAAK